MYSLEITPQVDKIFSKLSKRYPKQMDIIYKKVEQIIQNPYHFKPLKGDMHGARAWSKTGAYRQIFRLEI